MTVFRICFSYFILNIITMGLILICKGTKFEKSKLK